MLAMFAVLACIAIDGDTVRCGSERYRLLAIDAPETAGHCRTGRDCAPGDPVASKASLQSKLNDIVEIEPVNIDRYGRTVAVLYADGVNLSCHQLNTGHARYWPRYDINGRIRRECGIGD